MPFYYDMAHACLRDTHIVYPPDVFLVALAILLYQQPGRAKFEHCGAPLQSSYRLVSHHSLFCYFNFGMSCYWLLLTPKGSMALRLPCISWNNSVSVSVPSPFLPYFANMSSNCCGRKRPSLSYVLLSEPCYIYATSSASAIEPAQLNPSLL